MLEVALFGLLLQDVDTVILNESQELGPWCGKEDWGYGERRWRGDGMR